MQKYRMLLKIMCAGWVGIIFYLGMCSQGYGQTRVNPTYKAWKWEKDRFFTNANDLQLMDAIERDDLPKIKEIVKRCGNVNTRGKMNVTPLVWALLADSDTFLCLLELGADPNVPVKIEWKWGDPQLPTKLHNGCVALHICKYRICYTAYEYQYSYAHLDTIYPTQLRDALKFGANPNECTEKTEYSLLMSLFDAGPLAYRQECFKLLLEAGADVHWKNEKGATTLDMITHFPVGAALLPKSSIPYAQMALDAGAEITTDFKPEPFFIDIAQYLAYVEFSCSDICNDKEFKTLRQSIIDRGVDYELARQKIIVDGNRSLTYENFFKAIKLPLKERPWLQGVREKKAREKANKDSLAPEKKDS
ncbi:MAG: hypothetical protein Q4C96_08770 [Planctomycetia bacterium]|nr:hypothetical protein [Planctomycetia bacterium]